MASTWDIWFKYRSLGKSKKGKEGAGLCMLGFLCVRQEIEAKVKTTLQWERYALYKDHKC